MSSGRDELQIFDLSSQANTLKQNRDSLEVFYGKLITIWKEIDRRQPNAMIHAEDITIFNTFIQKQRLFQFLAGINETFDKEKRDSLNQDPLPTVEMAYATIRREISRRGIMTHTSSRGKIPSAIGSGLAVKHRSDFLSFRRETEDKAHLKCSYYGGNRHTREGCSKLIGFSEWLEEHRQRKAATKAPSTRIGGKANLATDVLHHDSMSIDDQAHILEIKKTNNEGELENGENGPEERERERGEMTNFPKLS